MSVKKKPLVVVTRKLPDSIETRMRELFDARLNLDDVPMTQEQLAEAVRTADILVPTVTDEINEDILKQPDVKLKLIANFGNGVDNIDVVAAHALHITVTNTPKVLTEDTADMTLALILAVPRRLIEGASILTDGKDWPGWSPTWMLGHRIGGKRLGIIGMGRIGPAVARPARALGPPGTLTQRHPRPQRAAHRRRTGRDLLGKSRPDAGADGHHLGELSTHPCYFSFALGAAAETDPQGRLYRQYRARRSDRRGDADQADRSRRDRRRWPRRVRARARGQSETGAAGEGRQGDAAAAYGVGHHPKPPHDGGERSQQHYN